MKNILCYGDSNTWGFTPGTGVRYTSDIRWTGKLQTLLGSDYKVIEEGLPGRTTVFIDPIDPCKTGITYLEPCLLSHTPLDLIILMLGTNDTKSRFNVTATEITLGLEKLIQKIKATLSFQQNDSHIIIVSPVPLRDDFTEGASFNSESAYKSKLLSVNYEDLAKKYGCYFVDAGEYITEIGIDNVHLTVNNHETLAIILNNKITDIFNLSQCLET